MYVYNRWQSRAAWPDALAPLAPPQIGPRRSRSWRRGGGRSQPGRRTGNALDTEVRNAKLHEVSI